jgi:hypothetical protein
MAEYGYIPWDLTSKDAQGRTVLNNQKNSELGLKLLGFFNP